jgi:hypothetical protein
MSGTGREVRRAVSLVKAALASLKDIELLGSRHGSLPFLCSGGSTTGLSATEARRSFSVMATRYAEPGVIAIPLAAKTISLQGENDRGGPGILNRALSGISA